MSESKRVPAPRRTRASKSAEKIEEACRALGVIEHGEVVKYAGIHELSKGYVLTKIGGFGEGFWVLVTAAARGVLADQSTFEVPTGSVVGEVSSLKKRLYQTADVSITTPGTALYVPEREWARLASNAPSLRALVERSLQARLQDLGERATARQNEAYAQYRSFQEALKRGQ